MRFDWVFFFFKGKVGITCAFLIESSYKLCGDDDGREALRTLYCQRNQDHCAWLQESIESSAWSLWRTNTNVRSRLPASTVRYRPRLTVTASPESFWTVNQGNSIQGFSSSSLGWVERSAVLLEAGLETGLKGAQERLGIISEVLQLLL